MKKMIFRSNSEMENKTLNDWKKKKFRLVASRKFSESNTQVRSENDFTKKN